MARRTADRTAGHFEPGPCEKRVSRGARGVRSLIRLTSFRLFLSWLLGERRGQDDGKAKIKRAFKSGAIPLFHIFPPTPLSLIPPPVVGFNPALVFSAYKAEARL